MVNSSIPNSNSQNDSNDNFSVHPANAKLQKLVDTNALPIFDGRIRDRSSFSRRGAALNFKSKKSLLSLESRKRASSTPPPPAYDFTEDKLDFIISDVDFDYKKKISIGDTLELKSNDPQQSDDVISSEPSEHTAPTKSLLRRVLSSKALKKIRGKRDNVVSDPETANAFPIPDAKKFSYFHLWSGADFWTLIYIAIGTFAGMLNGAVPPILNLIIGGLVNTVQEYEREYPNYKKVLFNELMFFVYCLIGLVVASLVVGYLQTYCWMVAAERQVKKIRELYFRAVVGQELRFFDENPAGELASRMTNDLNMMFDGMAEKVGYIIQYATSFVLGVLLAFVTSWQLTLILLACFPIPALALNRMWQQVGLNAEKIQSSYSKAGALATSLFRAISTVMSHNAQFQEEKRYSHLLLQAYQVSVKINIINAIGVGTAFFFFYIVRTIVFYLGGLLVLNGQLSGGDAVGTFLQLSSGVMFLGNIFTYISATTDAFGAGQKIFRILESKPEISTASDEGIKPAEFKGGIEFRNVSFSYPTRKEIQILRGLSFKIEPGQSVALVGMSGCGKSTVFQLLLRLYDVDEGEIYLDGINIKDLNVLWLREQMSLVSQEPVLFDGTIAENVAYGVNSHIPVTEPLNDVVIPRARILSALESSNALEFTSRLPNDIDTHITNGTALSGGQKQRIAIARAIIRAPKILMLDEATSALDSRSERVVQAAIDKLAKQQTTLCIAHRLSTIYNSDKILLLSEGKVVESGSHDELVAKKGMYFAMIEAQKMAKGNSDGEREQTGSGEEENIDQFLAQQASGSSELKVNAISDDEDGEKSFKNDVSESSQLTTSKSQPAGIFNRIRAKFVKNDYDTLEEPAEASSVVRKRSTTGHSTIEVNQAELSDENFNDISDVGLDEETKKKRILERKKEARKNKEKERLGRQPIPFRKLWDLIRLDLVYVGIGLIGAVFDGLLVPLEASLMGVNIGIYSNPVKYGGHQAIFFYSMLFIPLSFLALFAKSLQQYGFGIAGSRLTERLRVKAFSRIITMDMYFFDEERHSPGELSSNLASDADAVKRVGGLLIGQAITVTINSVVGMGIAFYAGWQLTLVMVGLTPLLFVATFIERKTLEGFTDSTKKAYEKSSQLSALVLGNIKTVIVLAKEQFFSEKYSASLIEPHVIGIKKAKVRAASAGVFQSLMIVVYIIAFMFCYYLIFNRILTFASIGVVILNVILTSVAAGALAASARSMTDAKVAANAIFELIDKVPKIRVELELGAKTADSSENTRKRRRSGEVLIRRQLNGDENNGNVVDVLQVSKETLRGILDEDGNPVGWSDEEDETDSGPSASTSTSSYNKRYSKTSDLDRAKPLIELSNVSFAFPTRPDYKVLKNISLSIPQNKKVALVGPSGSGKSTIAALLMRIYDPLEETLPDGSQSTTRQGGITFRGTDLRDWDVVSLRSQIGVVGQEPVLFDRSIEENIMFGFSGATREEVIEVAKAAMIHEFVVGLPNGYDTKVGDMGGRLSGGQKQRIAIARALLRRPKLLILDEATSALDSETETQVDEALRHASTGRTTVTIAHRLKTIQDSDIIYVISDGEVVEQGNHATLMNLKGLYYAMVLQQNISDDQ